VAAALPLPAEEYLTWLAVERGRSVNTLAAYRRDLAGWVAWLGERGRALGEVTEDDVAGYVSHLQHAGRAPASVARSLVAVRALHAFCAEEGLAAVDPAAEVAPPPVPRGLPRPLGEDEVLALLGSVTGTDAVARRDRAILELLYGTGMRISELCGLSLGDLDLEGGLLRVFGKGAKERVVPVGRHARLAMAAWLAPEGRPRLVPARWARRGDAEAVFLGTRGGRLRRQAAWEVVKHHGERVGLAARLSPHVLRHSCATHLLDHGADVRVVQELLGHASVATTQVYTQVSTERLRAVYDAAHPRARRPA
jgi:integrase/recombinase XerD